MRVRICSFSSPTKVSFEALEDEIEDISSMEFVSQDFIAARLKSPVRYRFGVFPKDSSKFDIHSLIMITASANLFAGHLGGQYVTIQAESEDGVYNIVTSV